MRCPMPRVEVKMEEFDTLLERAKTSPLSEQECARLKAALETLGYVTHLLEDRDITIHQLRQILFGASTEKIRNVFKKETPGSADNDGPTTDHKSGPTPAPNQTPKGHGRNGAASYAGAQKVRVGHGFLKPGDPCPECSKGKVYASMNPGYLVRIVGQAPLGGTVYELEKLRCNLCLEVFTAQAPEGWARTSTMPVREA